VKAILDYRKWPSLRSRAVISLTMSILSSLPVSLHQEIAQHGVVPSVAASLCGRNVNYVPYALPATKPSDQ